MYMKPGGRQFLVLVQLPRGALPSSLSMYLCVCVCVNSESFKSNCMYYVPLLQSTSVFASLKQRHSLTLS